MQVTWPHLHSVGVESAIRSCAQKESIFKMFVICLQYKSDIHFPDETISLESLGNKRKNYLKPGSMNSRS